MSQQEENISLAEHAFRFAQRVRDFGKRLPMSVANVEDYKELVRVSGAMGATLATVSMAQSREDFIQRMRSCVEAAMSAHYWLRLLDTQGDPALAHQKGVLLKIAEELHQVFADLIQPSKT